MTIDRISANVVLVPAELNVASFQQLWLLENGILERDEFGPGALFTPVAVQIPGAQFDLIVLEQRVQLTLKRDYENAGAIIERVIGGIASRVPRVTAVGFNFEFGFSPEQDASNFSRRFCLRDDNPLFDEFQDPAARFGLTLVKPYGPAKLNAQIAAATATSGGATKEAMVLKFNLHRDVASSDEVSEFLGTWGAAIAYCGDLSTRIEQSRQASHV